MRILKLGRRSETRKLKLIAIAAVAMCFMGWVKTMTVHADALPVVYESGAITSDETWTAGSVYEVAGDGVAVNNGVTLTIQAGTIIKYTTGYWNSGIKVSSGGYLSVEGTSANPVTFTSINDDSIGGDSGGDGPTVGTVGDYGRAIQVAGGSASIEYATIKYATIGVQAEDPIGSDGVVIADSTIDSTVDIGNTTGGHVTLERNTFDTDPGYYAISAGNNVDMSDVILSGVNENIFTGTGRSRVIYLASPEVASGETWAVSGTTGAVLDVDSGFLIYGTLDLQDGAIVKYGTEYYNSGMQLESGGALTAEGTSSNPVVLTSINDDSIGGDSANDGPTTGATGDYPTAIKSIYGGDINVSNIVIKDASLAVNINDGGSSNFEGATIQDVITGVSMGGGIVTFRGAFNNISNLAISTCNWGASNCSVDAAYTDWGNGDGPGNLVCGQVTTSPWKYDGATDNGGTFVANCDSSATPDTKLTNAASGFSTAVGNDDTLCSDENQQDACQAAQQALACLTGAISVASSESPFPLPGDDAGSQASTYAGDLLTGASTYVNSQEAETVVGDGLGFASDLFGAVNTVLSIANAYNSCA